MQMKKWNEVGVEWEPDHTLMHPEELAKCVRAYEAPGFDRFPIPTRNVSNGEYLPKPQTKQQVTVEQEIQRIASSAASALKQTYDRFVTGNGGIAAGLQAMNNVYGRFFDVSDSAVIDSAEFDATSLPADVFVFDDQLHFVRGKFSHDKARAAAQGPSSASSGFSANPYNLERAPDEHGESWAVWNPALVGLPIEPEAFHLVQFIKEAFLDSATTVGLISNVTAYVEFQPGTHPNPVTSVELARDDEILTAEQTAGARNFINEMAGTRRALCHGLLYTGRGNLDYIQYQLETHKPDSWKGYTVSNSAKVDRDSRSLMRRWRQDDEDVAYPTYELIAREAAKRKDSAPGLNIICVHKGLVPKETPADPEFGHPGDLPKACADWPQLNFVTYHSCIKDMLFYTDAFAIIHAAEGGEAGTLREGVPNIEWTTEFAQTTSAFKNSYAELGTTFASTVITFPTVAAHIIGQLLKYKGEDQIVWGTDSVWYGSPQWQIEAFWRFQIPEAMRERWGYPELTEQAKRKILGLNSARLYGIGSDPRRYSEVPPDYSRHITPEMRTLFELPQGKDNLAQAKTVYRDMGPVRSNLRYGWIRAYE
jgi:predicted TIM-barrel fold metal-dependent hydrolase